ncbi:MAG: methionyl-tRNA formyltransferase [Ruminococcaceae bacterium]|nr:methionyl-tRNA formyltransferase [Oscillospiraceae bacterium]
MKVLFMGTPAIAARVLEEILNAGHEVVGVLTQPDKSRNRGMKSTPSEVKVLALEKGLTVYQPETLRNEAIKPLLEELEPEVIVVVAYGKILPSYVLEYPKYRCINVHASLLPKYRGAAPIQRAIMAGEKQTGVTIMYMEKGIDTGDMLMHTVVPIAPDDTTETLTKKLANAGAPLMVEALRAVEAGQIMPKKQDESLQTYASMLSKEDGIIDWNVSAYLVGARIRGCDPWPCAEGTIDGVKLKLFAPVLCGGNTENAPGTVVEAGKKGLIVACGNGELLSIGEVQPAGKKRMPASAYFNGHPIKEKTIQ